MIRCEVEGCDQTSDYSLPTGWSQIGESRFADAPSRLASYCPKHQNQAISVAEEANIEREKDRKKKRKEHLYAQGINALRRFFG